MMLGCCRPPGLSCGGREQRSQKPCSLSLPSWAEAPLWEIFLHLVLIQLGIFYGALHLSVYPLFFRFVANEEYYLL